jgi:hypothetical protein
MTRRFKIFIGLTISVALIFIILVLAIFKFGLLEYVVNYRLNLLIQNKLPVKIEIGKISGDYFSVLTLADILIIYDDNNHRYEMAHVPQLTTEYSLSDLINGKLDFSRIFIDSAAISICQNEEGEWLIPRARNTESGAVTALEFSIEELGLNNLTFRLISPHDTITFKDIILAAHIEGRENTYSIDIDALSYQSSDSRLSLRSGGGKATLTGNNLLFQDILIITDSTDIQLGGQVVLEKSPQIKINLAAQKLNVHEIFSFLDIDLSGNVAAFGHIDFNNARLSGAVRLSGIFMEKRLDSIYTEFRFDNNILTLDTLSGKIFEGALIEANGKINLGSRPEEYYLNGRINNFNLNNLIFGSFQSNLNGNLQLNGQGLVDRELILNFNLRLDESWFDMYHAHLAAGNIMITADSIRFDNDFQIDYQDNRFFAGGVLEYSGDINISGRAEFGDLSAFNNKIFIKEMGGRGIFVGEISGELANPNLSGIFLSDSLWLYQIYASSARSEIDLEHFLYNRSGHASLNLFDGTAYDVPMDSCYITMALDSQYAIINKAEYYNSFADFQCIGSIDYASYPQKLMLDSVSLGLFELPLRNENQLEISIDSLGYDFTQLKLRRPLGYIGWNGRINYDETLELTLDGESIDIAPWVNLIAPVYKIGGNLSGQLHLSGSFQSPIINFLGGINSLSYQKLILGDLHASFDYERENVSIDSISLKSPAGFYYAYGNYPVNLALVEVADRFPENEQNITIKSQDVRFDLINLMLDEVEDMSGDFRTEIKLTGTPTRPKLDGAATVNNGWLKLSDLIDTLKNLNIELKMTDNTINFDKVLAECRGGSLSGFGRIIVNSIDQFNYDLVFDMNNFPARYELGEISGFAEKYHLTVRGDTPPTVRGDGIISGTNYYENFSEADEGWIILEAFEGEKTWDLNLDVEFPSNLWIKNDDIDAEFSGSLNFIRESGQYRFLGNLEVLRGKGFLAGRTFRIEPGGTINYEDIEYPNPRLDILASTKIRGAAPSAISTEQTIETFDLPVHITGTLDEPIIEAAAGSRLSTEEMIPVLFTNYYQDESSFNPSNTWLQDRMTSFATDYISTEMTKLGSRSLGVETFEIDPVYGDKYDPLGTRVTVGFYTHPNLYIYGRSAISGNAGQQVGFEYRLKRFMLLEGRADENDLYQLLINFYWEY